MSTTNNGLKFWDNSVRFDQIIWLAANVDQPCEALTDVIVDGGITYKNFAALFKITEKKAKGICASMETFTDWQNTNRIEGFLVYACTPVPTAFHDDGGMQHYGYGMTTGLWFYTEALDDAFLETVFAWRKEYIERKRVELTSKKGGV